jgi:hypothetical protein
MQAANARAVTGLRAHHKARATAQLVADEEPDSGPRSKRSRASVLMSE